MLMFASSLLLPLICSDRREAASYLGSHDEEQDATSEWSIHVCVLYVVFNCDLVMWCQWQNVGSIISTVPVLSDLLYTLGNKLA